MSTDGVGRIDRFNKRYNYPYVFLNDEPFTDEFKKYTSAIASSSCTYGQIPANQWGEQPDWIDQGKAKAAREEMERKKVIYGGSVSYRQMCSCFRSLDDGEADPSDPQVATSRASSGATSFSTTTNTTGGSSE